MPYRKMLIEILASLTATMGLISTGMQYAWTSSSLRLLHSKDTPVQISENDDFWLEITYIIGRLVAIPTTIFVARAFGSKRSILIVSTMELISWLLIGVARNVAVLYFARILTGAASSIAYVVVSMYLAENASAKIRGFLTSFIYIELQLGVLISYSTTPFLPIWISSAVGVGINFVQIFTFSFMPQSVYDLIIRSKTNEARNALRRLRQTDQIETELKDIEQAIERQNSERGRFIDLLLIRSNRKALFILLVVNLIQQLSGIAAIIMNARQIQTEAGSIVSEELSTILFGVCLLTGGCSASYFLDTLGRRIVLISSSIMTFLCLITLGTYFYVKNINQLDVSDYKLIPLICLLGFGLFYVTGLGLAPIVIAAEIFPVSVKTKGIILGVFMYNTAAMLALKIYHTTHHFGMFVPFYTFATCVLILLIISYFIVPETKGKTLDEIQQMLKRKKLIYTDLRITRRQVQ